MIALSWSRISDYRQCPLKFMKKYIEKAPHFQLKDEDKSPALVRGGNIHKQLEKYVLMKKDGIPTDKVVFLPEVQKMFKLIDGIMSIYETHPEKQIAINDRFEAVDWFDKNAWFRVIVDLLGFSDHLLLGDYKTGKIYPYEGSLGQLGQLHMTALVGMALWPQYEDVASSYIYVDHRDATMCRLNRRSSFELMKEALVREHEAINADDVFAPKKNRYCGFCEALPKDCKHKQ